MRRSFFRVAALVSLLAISASAAQAQTQRTTMFGIAAGATLPTGDIGNSLDMGYHVTGLISMKPSTTPIGFRVEGTYNNFSGEGTNSDFRIISGIVSALLGGRGTGQFSPYVIGGLGYYDFKADAPGAVSSGDLGVNVGVGAFIPLSGFTTFVEARFHNIFVDGGGNSRFIPITFGLTF
jgi:hypothetical protein